MNDERRGSSPPTRTRRPVQKANAPRQDGACVARPRATAVATTSPKSPLHCALVVMTPTSTVPRLLRIDCHRIGASCRFLAVHRAAIAGRANALPIAVIGSAMVLLALFARYRGHTHTSLRAAE